SSTGPPSAPRTRTSARPRSAPSARSATSHGRSSSACGSTIEGGSRVAVGTLENDVGPSQEARGSPGRERRLALAVLFCVGLPPAGSFAAQAQQALQRAAVLVQEGRLREADQQAQLALSDPATRAAACSVLGAIRVQQDRLAEGAELLQEAIRLDPHLLGAQLNLAQVYALQGKAELAVPVFRRVLELDPSNATARMAPPPPETETGNHKPSPEPPHPAPPP